jgi:hypothetical protein
LKEALVEIKLKNNHAMVFYRTTNPKTDAPVVHVS